MKSFGANGDNLPPDLSDHDEELVGDVRTTLFINFEWRRLIGDAVQSYADSIIASLDDDLVDDFRNQVQALLNDLYTQESMDGTPVGAIVWFPHDTIPTKWLKCDGTTFVSADYPELAELLSPGAPATNTGLPDLQNRFLFGASIDADLFDTGGSDQQTLATANLPAHTHTTPDHTHTYTAADNTGINTGRAARGGGTNVGANTGIISGGGGTSGSTGSGTAFSIMPPYIRGYWIIKALP